MAAPGKLRKPKPTRDSLLTAMARMDRRPRILATQGRAEARDRGARRAAIGGNPVSFSLPNEGVTYANGPTVSGSDRATVKPSR